MGRDGGEARVTRPRLAAAAIRVHGKGHGIPLPRVEQ